MGFNESFDKPSITLPFILFYCEQYQMLPHRKDMRYHIFVRNTKDITVPKRARLLLKSYLRKRLMKLENTMTIDKE